MSDRFHSPVVANNVAGIVGWIAMPAYANLQAVLGGVNDTFFYIVAFLFDGLGRVLILWKRHYLDTAPGIVSKKVAGVPLVTLTGVYNVIFIGAIIPKEKSGVC